MKLNKILALAVLGLALASCGSIKPVYPYLRESNARILEPAKDDCTVMPLAVDLEVSAERITNTIEYSWSVDVPLEKHKVNAISETAIKFDCDVIVAAMTQSETFEEGRKLRITVTGYPAFYKDFRKITDKDLELLKKTSEQQAPVEGRKVASDPQKLIVIE